MRKIAAGLALLVGAGYTAAATASAPLVAIIDSGVAATAELKPLLVDEVDVASTKQRAAFHPRYDHGTMVATILARTARHNVRIISYRIDDPAGCPAGASPPCQPSGEPVARAIRLATESGVDAINLSLSLKEDPAITEAVHEAAARGIIVVMAAGNDGMDHPVNLGMARAGYPRAVLVGALDENGRAWTGGNAPGDHSAGAYNFAWQRGVAVPTNAADGSAVLGTGTSFATPIETARLVSLAPRNRAGGGGVQTLR